MKLSDALRMGRAAKKLSQRQVADHLGLKQQAVSEWEKGGGVDKKHWGGIKELLDVDVSAYLPPMLTDYAMDALAKRLEAREILAATGDNSTNAPIRSHDNTESPISVKVTHNNGTAPPQSGKQPIELSEKEERIINALRKIGKDDYTDGLMEKVEAVAKALSW